MSKNVNPFYLGGDRGKDSGDEWDVEEDAWQEQTNKLLGNGNGAAFRSNNGRHNASSYSPKKGGGNRQQVTNTYRNSPSHGVAKGAIIEQQQRRTKIMGICAGLVLIWILFGGGGRNSGDYDEEFLQLVVLGERHSGVSYVRNYLQQCYPDVTVTSTLQREGLFFQDEPPSRSDDKNMNNRDGYSSSVANHRPVIIVHVVTNVYDWVHRMRLQPEYMPNHIRNVTTKQPLEWKEFIDRPWTLPERPQRDLELSKNQKQSHKKVCQMEFAYDQVMSCVEASYDGVHDSIDINPIYELNPYDNGKPFDSILELRAAKFRNVKALEGWDFVDMVLTLNYDSISSTDPIDNKGKDIASIGGDSGNTKLNDMAKLLSNIDLETGWYHSCGNSGEGMNNAPTLFNLRNNDMTEEYYRYIDDNVDWDIEKEVAKLSKWKDSSEMKMIQKYSMVESTTNGKDLSGGGAIVSPGASDDGKDSEDDGGDNNGGSRSSSGSQDVSQSGSVSNDESLDTESQSGSGSEFGSEDEDFDSGSESGSGSGDEDSESASQSVSESESGSGDESFDSASQSGSESVSQDSGSESVESESGSASESFSEDSGSASAESESGSGSESASQDSDSAESDSESGSESESISQSESASGSESASMDDDGDNSGSASGSESASEDSGSESVESESQSVSQSSDEDASESASQSGSGSESQDDASESDSESVSEDASGSGDEDESSEWASQSVSESVSEDEDESSESASTETGSESEDESGDEGESQSESGEGSESASEDGSQEDTASGSQDSAGDEDDDADESEASSDHDDGEEEGQAQHDSNEGDDGLGEDDDGDSDEDSGSESMIRTNSTVDSVSDASSPSNETVVDANQVSNSTASSAGDNDGGDEGKADLSKAAEGATVVKRMDGGSDHKNETKAEENVEEAKDAEESGRV